MSKLRVAMIGTGGISHWHAKQLGELDEVEVVALVDPVANNRKVIMDKYGFTSAEQFEDYKEMLDQINPDAVVICSPHTLHGPQIITALNHGCHVLVEKPMACSSEEADRVLAAAKKNDRILQVSYQRHVTPEFLYIKDAVDSGKIGKLTSVTAFLSQEWKQLTKGTWRQSPQLSGGGMLMDSGSHIIDILLWIVGADPVEAKGLIQNQGAPVEIDSFTSIRFANGVIAGLNIVGFAPKWHEFYVICGEDGAIFYDNGKITLQYLGEEPIIPELPEQTTNQDKSFIDAILGRHEVKIPGDFARKVVKLTEMIYQSESYEPIPSKK